MNLANVGMLLIGVGFIIFAVVAVSIYLDTKKMYSPPEPPPLSAYCHDGYMVISARVDQKDVKVVDPDGKVYCTFTSIKAGAEKLCRVGNATVYLVESGDFSRVVQCFRPVPVIPPWD